MRKNVDSTIKLALTTETLNPEKSIVESQAVDLVSPHIQTRNTDAAAATSSLQPPNPALCWGIDYVETNSITVPPQPTPQAPNFTGGSMTIGVEALVAYTNAPSGSSAQNFYHVFLTTTFTISSAMYINTHLARGWGIGMAQAQVDVPQGELISSTPTNVPIGNIPLYEGSSAESTPWSPTLAFASPPTGFAAQNAASDSQFALTNTYMTSPWNSLNYPVWRKDQYKLLNYGFYENSGFYYVSEWPSAARGKLTGCTSSYWRVPASSKDVSSFKVEGQLVGSFMCFQQEPDGTGQVLSVNEYLRWWWQNLDLISISNQNGVRR